MPTEIQPTKPVTKLEELDINEQKLILKHGADSSDDEDNYKEYSPTEFRSNLDKFKQSTNLPKELAETAYLLESEGRRVLYTGISRQQYLQKKEQEMSYSPSDFKEIIKAINSAKILSVLEETYIHLTGDSSPSTTQYQERINQIVQNLNSIGPRLPRLTLKQFNREFLTTELATAFKPIIDHIIEYRKKQITSGALNHKSIFQLTSKVITSDETIKRALQEKVRGDLVEIQTNAALDVQQKLTAFQDKFGKVPTKAVTDNLADHQAKFNANSINPIVEEILVKEISSCLTESFSDRRVQPNFDQSYLLKFAIELAQQKQIELITNRTLANFTANNTQEQIVRMESLKVSGTFSKSFSELLHRSLEKDLDLLPNRNIRRTYNDTSEIKSPFDLYNKEHLLYRAATRQSRRAEQEVARSVVFKDDEDLTAQKWQSVKSASASTEKRISYRGTLQEEVYNLGNYESVLKVIQSLGLDDRSSAHIIRGIYKVGIDAVLKSRVVVGNKALSDFFNNEQKKNLVELVELFFGTEAFRSPSTIVETNMALDLIIAGKLTWKDALTEKQTVGKGGELSFTMKSAEDAGGIECGRRLSEDVNQIQDRKHKYGGIPIDQNSMGYKEYLNRKKDIVTKWLQEKAPGTTVGDPEASKTLIRSQNKTWYGKQ